MLKATSILTSVLSALVIMCAMLPIDPLPAQAQTVEKLNCTGCVRSKQLRNNGIKSVDIRNGQVKNADLANDVVTSGKIADGAVTFDKLASDVKGLVPPSFELRDRNGLVIGTVLTILTKGAITRVGFKDSFAVPRFVPLLVVLNRIELDGILYYGSPGCSESMGVFIEPKEALSPAFDPFAILDMPGARPLYVANTEIASMVQVASRQFDDICETFPAEMRLLLSAEKVVDDLSSAFQAPYELVIN